VELPKAARADAEWDGGELSCGELVLALRQRMQRMPPGGVLKVVVRDPAAPIDLPAWCRVTGNRLVAMSHPEYFIERKGE
jgi:TusA-related sulfurtransferase